MESNDSPEIPDIGDTADIPGLPSEKGDGGECRIILLPGHCKLVEQICI